MKLNIPKDIVAKVQFAEIQLGSYAAVNNTWGDQGMVFLKQSIRTRKDLAAVRMRWDIKPEAPNQVMGFPNITCGKHPWGTEATTKELPVRLQDVKSIPVIIDYSLFTKGKCNAVLDCWITSGQPHGPAEIVMEAMIWFEARGYMVPHGIKVPDRSEWVGRSTFDKKAVPIVSRFPGGEGQLAFDLKSILVEMIGRRLDHLGKDAYLSAIELGSECAAGKGWMDVRRFDIDIIK